MKGRDPKQPFTRQELKSIQLAICDLHEFKEGYLHIRRLRNRGLGERNPELDRFFETAFIAILDGLYPPNRTTAGVLPVLRLVNCNTLANEIEAALDRKVGSSTFAEILNTYRDKAIAHPRYSKRAMWPIVTNFRQHLQKQQDIDAFNDAANIAKRDTAAAYVWFQTNYPQIVAHADAPIDLVDNQT